MLLLLYPCWSCFDPHANALHICRPDIATDLDEAAASEDGAEASEGTVFLRGPDETAEAYARRIFTRVFEEDIVRVLSMEVSSARCST